MFYDDNLKMRSRVNLNDLSASEVFTHYLKHYQISLLLRATERNAASFEQKSKAREQLTIAERKISYWERHKRFEFTNENIRCLTAVKQMNMSDVCVNL